MTEQYSEKEINKALFAQLVMMLSSSVMQQLGKLVNPSTHKAEIDLEGAQITIDLLSMLKEKTKGNLDKEEESMMESILSSLQMNYVETAQSAPKTEEKSEPTSQKEEPSGPKEESAAGPKTDPKDPKYHKSYGS